MNKQIEQLARTLGDIVFQFISPGLFWLIWSHWGFAAKYCYWLPMVYHRPSPFDCYCLFYVVFLLKELLPRIHLTIRKDPSSW